MDGFRELSASPMWAALKKAEAAAFKAQQVCRKHGFDMAAALIYGARLDLGSAENNLRHQFKHRSDAALKFFQDDEPLTPEEEAAVREGLEDMKAGRTKPLEQVLKELEEENQ
jgi:predicted transcriptional regulator